MGLVPAAQFLQEEAGHVQLFFVVGRDGKDHAFHLLIGEHFHGVHDVADLGKFLLFLLRLLALVLRQPRGRGNGDHAGLVGVAVQQIGHGHDGRAHFAILVGGAGAKTTLFHVELAIIPNVGNQAAVIVAQVIAAFISVRLAVLVGVVNGETGLVIAPFRVGVDLLIQRLKNNLGGGDGEFFPVLKGGVFAPVHRDHRGAVGDGVGGGDLGNKGAVFVAGADGLFPASQLLRVFTGAAGRLGGGVHIVDGFHVGGGGVAFGQALQLLLHGRQLFAALLDFGAVAVGVLPRGQLAGRDPLFQLFDIFRFTPHGGLQGGGAGVRVQGMGRGQGGAVGVEIVRHGVGIIFHGEQVAGKLRAVTLGVDGNAGAGLAGGIVQGIEAADQLIFAVDLDTVIEKLDGSSHF